METKKFVDKIVEKMQDPDKPDVAHTSSLRKSEIRELRERGYRVEEPGYAHSTYLIEKS